MAKDYDFSNLTILIVDDQAFLRSIVRGVLRDFRCRSILEAANGEEAIAILEGEKVDVIICDVIMEPVDGLQLVKTVRAGLTGAPYDTPIVMLTGHAETDIVQSAIDLHVNGFIIKPVSPQNLATRIDLAVSTPLMISPPSMDEASPSRAAGSASSGAGGRAEPILRKEEDLQRIKEEAISHLVARRIWEIQEGAILAQDVFDPSGVKLVRRGLTLTEEYLKFLKNEGSVQELLILE